VLEYGTWLIRISCSRTGGAHTFSACEPLIKRTSQYDLPTTKMQNIYLSINILRIPLTVNIDAPCTPTLTHAIYLKYFWDRLVDRDRRIEHPYSRTLLFISKSAGVISKSPGMRRIWLTYQENQNINGRESFLHSIEILSEPVGNSLCQTSQQCMTLSWPKTVLISKLEDLQ